MRGAKFFVVSLVGLLLIGGTVRPAMAQTKEARGSVVTVSDSSLTVKVGTTDMKFAVDAKTIVGAPGAGRATRDAQTQGAAGAKLTSVVKPGAGVIVTYREAAGVMTATEIRSVPAAASANATGTTGGSTGGTSASGKVKAVTAQSLVITDNGKDMAFAVDNTTKVFAKGAGTATAAAGGAITFNRLVGVGDEVTVNYAGTGQAMRATEVRITLNADRPRRRRVANNNPGARRGRTPVRPTPLAAWPLSPAHPAGVAEPLRSPSATRNSAISPSSARTCHRHGSNRRSFRPVPSAVRSRAFRSTNNPTEP